MKHKNIPVFIPHLGCPNDCVFCNQRTISGTIDFDEGAVAGIIEEAVSTLSPGDEAEIAFFGGSFTGIDRDLMVRLLKLSDAYLKDGRVGSVRCSTRPDYIDADILGILGEHGVKTVELGIQSMDDSVLSICKRGHTSADTRKACDMIIKAGFELVGQMMVGLPGASPESEVRTAREICRLGARAARVYPTVVFSGTELCSMAKRGEYTPLGTEEAVARTAAVLRVFDECKIKVLRVGLCASENLSSDELVYGGASHPAIGELAMSEIYYENIVNEADSAILKMPKTFFDEARSLCPDGIVRGGRTMVIEVPTGAASKAAGQRQSNIGRIKARYAENPGIKHIKILENPSLISYNILISFI